MSSRDMESVNSKGRSFSVKKFDTELNKIGIYVYHNYEHYRKATMGLEEYYLANRSAHKDRLRLSWEMSLVSPQVRELINDAREKKEQKEEYHRQVQERKNKYPHLFKERSQ